MAQQKKIGSELRKVTPLPEPAPIQAAEPERELTTA